MAIINVCWKTLTKLSTCIHANGFACTYIYRIYRPMVACLCMNGMCKQSCRSTERPKSEVETCRGRERGESPSRKLNARNRHLPGEKNWLVLFFVASGVSFILFCFALYVCVSGSVSVSLPYYLSLSRIPSLFSMHVSIHVCLAVCLSLNDLFKYR